MLNQAVPSRFSPSALSRAFVRDDKGTIIQLFALSLTMVCGIMGLAVDGGRAMSAHNKAGRALDSAALAAARSLMSSNADDAELTRQAREFFKSNTEQGGSLIAYYDNVRVVVDRANKTVRVSADTRVPTFFARVVGFDEFKFGTSATASFNLKDIELGLQLDLTGSMCWPSSVSNGINSCTSGVKLDALKVASNNLVDDLMPEGRLNKVRIGLAPFSAGVDAGAYAAAVSDGQSTRCVKERSGGDATTDEPPSTSNPFQPAASCPASSPVLPLSDDKATIKGTIDGYAANGSTAGHLGTSWAWYVVSPKWASLWPDSTPVEYGTKDVLKAVVLMTDGKYNTFNGVNGGDFSPQATASRNAAEKMCKRMSDEGVVVYSILFMETDPTTVESMKKCATDKNGVTRFFAADDPAALNAAFREIAFNLNNLRIAE